jgi:hypothetical protein
MSVGKVAGMRKKDPRVQMDGSMLVRKRDWLIQSCCDTAKISTIITYSF